MATVTLPLCSARARGSIGRAISFHGRTSPTMVTQFPRSIYSCSSDQDSNRSLFRMGVEAYNAGRTSWLDINSVNHNGWVHLMRHLGQPKQNPLRWFLRQSISHGFGVDSFAWAYPQVIRTLLGDLTGYFNILEGNGATVYTFNEQYQLIGVDRAVKIEDTPPFYKVADYSSKYQYATYTIWCATNDNIHWSAMIPIASEPEP